MKKNDIIFWTKEVGLPEIEPIKPSQYYIPQWFQNTPTWLDHQISKVDNPTVKGCPGIADFFKMGFVIPLWCDLYINVKEDGTWTWRTPHKRFYFESHEQWQFKDHIAEEVQQNIKIVLKAYCPWFAKTPKDVSLLQLPMSYHFDSRFSLMPGIIRTDVHHFINQQLIIHNEGETFIPRGTPLGMYVPIRQEKWNLILRDETPEDNKTLDRLILALDSKFSKRYRNLTKSLDK